MQRCWTLQEGYLARTCVLQLAAGTVEIASLDPRHYDDYSRLVPLVDVPPILHLAARIYQRLRGWCGRPRKITTRNPLVCAVDTIHAAFIAILAIVFNLLTWPLGVLKLRRGGPRSAWLVSPDYHEEEVRRKDLNQYRRVCNAVCTEVRMSLDQLFSISDDSSHQSRFLRAWKAMLSRSTTEPQDIHAIIANLTGFSSREVLANTDTQARMRDILYMIDNIPLDILYIDGRKFASNQDSADRWMPIWPCDSALSSESHLRFKDQGFLIDLAGRDLLYAISGSDLPAPTFELLAWRPSVSGELNDTEKWTEVIEISCFGISSADESKWTAEQKGRRHYLLLEGNYDIGAQGRVERGALLQSIEQVRGEHIMRYSCTVGVRKRLSNVNIEDSIVDLYMTRADVNDCVYLEKG